MYSDPLQLTITDHGALGWRGIIIYRKTRHENYACRLFWLQ